MIPFFAGLGAMLRLTADLNLDCFSADYSRAHRRAREAFSALPAALVQGRQTYTHPLVGPHDEQLCCEALLVGQSNRPRHLLVLVSGTHGVEGFAGSAIQIDSLPLLAEAISRNASLGVVVIHAFNPWGFAWLRRSDHEGIDLNRNFADFSGTLPENPDYELLFKHINNLGQDGFGKLETLWQENGIEAFADAFTRGQYRHADGCFYGGRAPSWSRQLLEQFTSDPLFHHAERIAVIDLHTGLGPYGYGELINDHVPGTAGDEWVHRWFGANARSAQRGESVSTMKVGLHDFYWHRLIGDRGCFVTLEYGTYYIERLLTALIQEQLYQNSVQCEHSRRDLANPTVQELRNFFYPDEPSWQRQVLFRGRQVVSMACEGLTGG